MKVDAITKATVITVAVVEAANETLKPSAEFLAKLPEFLRSSGWSVFVHDIPFGLVMLWGVLEAGKKFFGKRPEVEVLEREVESQKASILSDLLVTRDDEIRELKEQIAALSKKPETPLEAMLLSGAATKSKSSLSDAVLAQMANERSAPKALNETVNVALERIAQIYRTHTSVHAETLTADFRGVQTMVVGRVYDVAVNPSTPGQLTVTLHATEGLHDLLLVYLHFEPLWAKQVRSLQTDEPIEAIGTLVRADQFNAHLRDCKLLAAPLIHPSSRGLVPSA